MTATALLLAPLACAVTLGVSGWAKMGDITGIRLAFVAMGVPAALSRPAVVRALPYAELTLGLALLLTWSRLLAVVGAVATALFVVYAVLVARVLQTGDSVECNCFGNLGGDRVTSATLARNLVLVALGAIATAFGAGGSGVIPALGDLEGAEWWWPVMTALLVLLAVLIVRPGPAADLPVEDVEEDYLRQPIPVGVLVAEDGRRVQLRALAAQRPQLLVFLSVGCGSCDVLADLLPGIAERLRPDRVEVAAVFYQPLEIVPDTWKGPGITPYHDPEKVVTDLFVSSRPAAVLFGADGMLAGGPVNGTRQVEAFVDDIVAELEAVTAERADLEAAPDSHHGQDHGHDHEHDHGHAAEVRP